MKNILVVIVSMAFLIFSSCYTNAWMDDDYEDKWNIGVTTSAVIPVDEALGTGIDVHGMISYDIFKYLAIGVEGGYTANSVEEFNYEYGDLYTYDLLGDIILKAPLEMEDLLVVPYIVNGFGWAYLDTNKNSDTIENLIGSFETENGFMYKVGAGIDIYILENVAINFEGSYKLSEADITLKKNSPTSESTGVATHAFFLGGGLKIKF